MFYLDYHAASKYKLKIIIRCNADCPFIDKNIKRMLKIYKKKI